MTLLMLKEEAQALPARERERIATSLFGVEQLADTVLEFLDLTRIEAGEMRLNLESVHVPAVLGEAVRHVEAQATAQGTAIRLTVATDLPPLVGDPRRLRVVFDNLLSNALKYTPGAGTVSLTARKQPGLDGDPDCVVVEVLDAGPGVSAPYRTRVFEKFFRLEHQPLSDRSHARGAGIGLYMCRQIVELHGGSIACTVGLDGLGACLVVTLPSRQAVASTAGLMALTLKS